MFIFTGFIFTGMTRKMNFFFSPSPFSSGSSTPSGIGESGSSVTNPEPRASSILAPTTGEFILILTVYTSSGSARNASTIIRQLKPIAISSPFLAIGISSYTLPLVETDDILRRSPSKSKRTNVR